MGWIIAAVLSIIVGVSIGFGIYAYQKNENDEVHVTPPLIGTLGGILLAIILIFFGCIAEVPTGNTGIITTFGKVDSDTLDSGLHFKAPWQDIITMDNRVQKQSTQFSCFSSDIQEVTCLYTVNYQISKTNASEIYKTIGTEYFSTVVMPNIVESVKTITARYTAEQLIGKRDTLAAEIEMLLSEALSKYNIELVSTAIEDLDFTDEFTNAVEAKQVAQQNKLKAQTEQEQRTMETEEAAKRAKIEAEAAANVAKIEAEANLEVRKITADAIEYEAEKQASANKKISESLSKELLTYEQIKQWDGKYPTTMLGNDSSFIIDTTK